MIASACGGYHAKENGKNVDINSISTTNANNDGSMNEAVSIENNITDSINS